jgi:DNA-binding transcriptional ArsR family regulator
LICSDMLIAENDERLQIKAKLFRGFADPNRLAILEALCFGEKNVSELVEATGISQSTVSNHLRCLLASGLVKNRRDGRNVLYRFRDDSIVRILALGDALLGLAADHLRTCVHTGGS